MDKYDTLHNTIASSFPQIIDQFRVREFYAFRESHEDAIIYPPQIWCWIRDELIGCEGPLLHAFIACGYSDRDDMTMYILQEFKDCVDGSK